MKAIFLPIAVLWFCAAGLASELTIREALDIADRENPEVQVARLKSLEAGIVAARSRSELGPRVDLRMLSASQTSNLRSIGVAYPGFPSRVGPYWVFDLRPRLQQTVLDLSLWSSVRADRLRARAAAEEAEASAERIRMGVVDLFLQALAADSRHRAALARVSGAAALAAQAAEREREGTASRLDTARAVEQLERESAVAAVAAGDREVARSFLAQALGMEPGSLPELGNVEGAAAPRIPASLAESLERRPETRAAGLRASALRSDIESARRERLPRLTAAADFGAAGTGPVNSLSTYTVAAELSIPLWTSGRTEKGVALARNRLEQQESESRRIHLVIARELAEAGAGLSASLRALQAASRALGAARESLELAQLRNAAGLATQLDVVTAQAALAVAEEEEIRFRFDGWLAAAKLAYAGGSVRDFLK